MKNQDKVRRLLRGVLPRGPYAYGARVLDAFWIIATQGIGVYRNLMASADGHEQLRSVNLRGYVHPFHFRPGTSDVGVLVNNLIRKEYGRLPYGMEAEFVIDAGGNIGDTAVYFLNRFKSCRVVTLEPHPAFFAIAERNLAPYPNATLTDKGLWSHQTKLQLSDGSTGSSVCSRSDQVFEIECVDVDTLLKEYGSSRIDILKMDIEGAEQQVLLNNSEKWLASTRLVIAELHGPVIAEECTRYLEQRGFDGFRYRSLHYFVNRAMRNAEGSA